MSRNLKVILIHGTWATSSAWAQEGSVFERAIRAQLSPHFTRIEHRYIPWSGKQSWRERERTADALADTLEDISRDKTADWDILIVGHSHAGNIATEGARKALTQTDPRPSILGVVCLNTPFLKQEIRASTAYLKLWLAFGLLLLAVVNVLGYFTPGGESLGFLRSFQALTLGQIDILLLLLCAVAGLMILLHRKVDRRDDSEDMIGSQARPKVLCLSCPDDEAITALGLTEGIANLPQLLTHPWAMVLMLGWMGFAVFRTDADLACLPDVACQMALARIVTTAYTTWLFAAVMGAAAGAIVMWAAFGLTWKRAVESLVSRVLVSYVPLQPADSEFRGIAELGWTPRPELLHSTIYRAPRTFEEIVWWFKRHHVKPAAPAAPAAAPLP